MSSSEALALVEEAAQSMPRAELPGLVGELERVKTVVLAKLLAPAPVEEDELLTAVQAAPVMEISPKTLLRHADEYPFTVRPVPGSVRFSRVGLQAWLRRRRGGVR